MAGPEFAAGFEALKAHAMRRMTALMCAEGLWWHRHRRLICDALTVEGWEVVHIDPDGGATAHELTPFAVCEDGRLTYPPAQAPLG